MERLKERYEDAELELVYFEFSDIVTASGEGVGNDGPDLTPPSSGDWDNEGWL